MFHYMNDEYQYLIIHYFGCVERTVFFLGHFKWSKILWYATVMYLAQLEGQMWMKHTEK